MVYLDRIRMIDPRTLKVVGTIHTGQAESHMLTITRDGRRGYTAKVGPGTVSVLDLDARKTIAVINLLDWKVDKLIDAGSGADGLAWAASK